MFGSARMTGRRLFVALILLQMTGCSEPAPLVEPARFTVAGKQTMPASDIGRQLRDRCPAAQRLAWIPYWDQQRASASFMANADMFSHVSLFWYYLDEEGEIRKYRRAREDQALLRFARTSGVKTLALIANDGDSTTENWDRHRVARVIRDPERRQAHIEDLVELANELGFDGINIDYEALDRQDRDDFTRFINELAQALHVRGKILAVAIHPKTALADPKEDNGSHAQDLPALAQAADQMHFMTYGQHGAGTGPGPIATTRWVDDVLSFAIDKRRVPADKLFVGVPLYAEAWRERTCWSGSCFSSDDDLVFADVIRRQALATAPRSIHAGADGAFLSYEQGGSRHVLWYEDAASVLAKFDMAARRGVCNAAFWRLGGEDEAIWEALRGPGE